MWLSAATRTCPVCEGMGFWGGAGSAHPYAGPRERVTRQAQLLPALQAQLLPAPLVLQLGPVSQ